MCGCGIDVVCHGCTCGCKHGTSDGYRQQAQRFALQAQSNAKQAEMWMGRAEEAGWMKPSPSLRDEVHEALLADFIRQAGPWGMTDAVLAIVRRHVEALNWDIDSGPSTAAVLRRDVLTLLGAGDD